MSQSQIRTCGLVTRNVTVNRGEKTLYPEEGKPVENTGQEFKDSMGDLCEE